MHTASKKIPPAQYHHFVKNTTPLSGENKHRLHPSINETILLTRLVLKDTFSSTHNFLTHIRTHWTSIIFFSFFTKKYKQETFSAPHIKKNISSYYYVHAYIVHSKTACKFCFSLPSPGTLLERMISFGVADSPAGLTNVLLSKSCHSHHPHSSESI